MGLQYNESDIGEFFGEMNLGRPKSNAPSKSKTGFQGDKPKAKPAKDGGGSGKKDIKLGRPKSNAPSKSKTGFQADKPKKKFYGCCESCGQEALYEEITEALIKKATCLCGETIKMFAEQEEGEEVVGDTPADAGAEAPAPAEGEEEAPEEEEEEDDEDMDITDMDVKEIASAFDDEKNIEKLQKLAQEVINTISASDFLDDEDKEDALEKLAKAAGGGSSAKEDKEKEKTSEEDSAADVDASAEEGDSGAPAEG